MFLYGKSIQVWGNVIYQYLLDIMSLVFSYCYTASYDAIPLCLCPSGRSGCQQSVINKRSSREVVCLIPSFTICSQYSITLQRNYQIVLLLYISSVLFFLINYCVYFMFPSPRRYIIVLLVALCVSVCFW